MTHPRLIPSNGRVALKGWELKTQADQFVDAVVWQAAESVVDLCRSPDGPLDCQLLYGAEFQVIEDIEGWSFGRIAHDGYVGYVRTKQLKVADASTHKLTALSSHIYGAADMKAATIGAIPFAARVSGRMGRNRFLALTTGGYVPAQHVQPIADFENDFVTQFEQFLGIPYLWGGNSTAGMDCSGALQLALYAAGHACPRDTDMQVLEVGQEIPDGAALMRGDLIFWQGHVGVMQNAENLIHANAHHMAVAIEPLDGAMARIERAGGGPVTARKRP